MPNISDLPLLSLTKDDSNASVNVVGNVYWVNEESTTDPETYAIDAWSMITTYLCDFADDNSYMDRLDRHIAYVMFRDPEYTWGLGIDPYLSTYISGYLEGNINDYISSYLSSYLSTWNDLWLSSCLESLSPTSMDYYDEVLIRQDDCRLAAVDVGELFSTYITYYLSDISYLSDCHIMLYDNNDRLVGYSTDDSRMFKQFTLPWLEEFLPLVFGSFPHLSTITDNIKLYVGTENDSSIRYTTIGELLSYIDGH